MISMSMGRCGLRSATIAKALLQGEMDDMNYHRNEKGSRATILKRLAVFPKGQWVTCRDAMGHCGEGGPWSEDLQTLVVEGAVESQVPIEKMSMTTHVRMK